MTFPCTEGTIASALDFLQESLSAWGFEKKRINAVMLTAEELMVKMIQASADGDKLSLSVEKILGTVSVRISARGSKTELTETTLSIGDLSGNEYAPEAEQAIRSMILNAHREEIQLKHRMGVNTAVLRVQKSEHANLITTLMFMVCGILFGLALRLLTPAAVSQWISDNVLYMVSKLFVNGIMMLVAPLVFFSMASCIAKYTDLRSLGRMGAKVIACYILTTIVAISIGFSVFQLLQPGDPAMMAAVTDAGASAIETAGSTTLSLRDTLLSIVPNNFARAFVDSDMIQVIVLGILLGAAAGSLGQYTEPVQHAFDAMNELFSRAVTIIVKVMPVAIFCSMAKMVITMNASTLWALLGILGCVYLGAFLLIAFYGLLLLVFGRINPLMFFRKFLPVMVSAFSLASSNAVMPLNMKTLDEKIGVSRKVYAFSIPLGATINMDGFCNYLIITTLALAKVAGVSFTGSQILSIFVFITLLSLGAPGVPGVGIVCLTMLLGQLSLPLELVSLVIGIYSMIDLINTTGNITGDAIVTTIVAKSEGLLDMDVLQK